jgi:hypothetical protein
MYKQTASARAGLRRKRILCTEKLFLLSSVGKLGWFARPDQKKMSAILN